LKAYLVDSPAGLFLLEKTGKIAEKVLFPRNPKDAAESVSTVRQGLLPKASAAFSDGLAKFEIDSITVDSEHLARIARSLGDFQVILDQDDNTIAKLRNRLPSILVRLRLVESKDEYETFTRDVSMELAKTAITEAATKRDLYAIQTVRCIEDLDKTLNLLAGRIREWYGLHFPELDRIIEKHDSYIRLVHNLGTRDNFTYDALVKQGMPQDRSTRISEAAQRSAGADMPAPDMDWLREVCSETLQMYKLRDTAEKYTDKIMEEVAPNMTGVLGAVLSAKLVSMAGGLENVAKMPASTLQVLGAEKALFRTLTTGARPPKHGIIFQYADIHQSPRWLRGKIARAVAGKLAIAARMDAYGGANEGQKFRQNLDTKIRELKDRYRGQPPRKKYAPGRSEPTREDRRRLLGKPAWRKGEAGHAEPGTRDQRLRRDQLQAQE
jgi:nucleolar protein 56